MYQSEALWINSLVTTLRRQDCRRQDQCGFRGALEQWAFGRSTGLCGDSGTALAGWFQRLGGFHTAVCRHAVG